VDRRQWECSVFIIITQPDCESRLDNKIEVAWTPHKEELHIFFIVVWYFHALRKKNFKCIPLNQIFTRR